MLVEELRDAIAEQGLAAQTARMLLSISENGVARAAILLEDGRKQVRLAHDRVESASAPIQRQRWLLQLAEIRVQSNQATIEAAELERQVTLENLTGLRKYLEFLERKLAAAQAQVLFTRTDLEVILGRLNDKRAELRRELQTTITQDADLGRALDAAREHLRLAQAESETPPGRLSDLRLQVEAWQARTETSQLHVDVLRAYLALADYIQTVWEDRFWAAGNPTLTELRKKRQTHQESMERFRPWKAVATMNLSAAASQALLQSVRSSATNLSSLEREAAKQIQAALEERATLCQRSLSAMSVVENVSERLLADLGRKEGAISPAGRVRFLFDGMKSFLERLWNAELYVAEDSVIAGGQKISVPRSITLGKVVVALGIFLGGLVIARWGHSGVKQVLSRCLKASERIAGPVSRMVAGLIVVIALFVAMTSVRIPWTVFAFLGGALAIGVGFGAQTLINNFISGVILIFERSIRVGDIVEVKSQCGMVQSVGFRSSLIKRGDGIDVLIPNSKFLETEVVNWTLTDDRVRYKITVSAAYGSSPRTVSRLITQAAMEHPQVVKTPAPQVLFEDFGDNGLIFALVFWMELQPRTDGGVVRSELRHRIHQLCEEADIVLAFPQRDVHLDSARPLEVRLVQHEASSEPAPRSHDL
jgi:small-conductance mechanosensitive channel